MRLLAKLLAAIAEPLVEVAVLLAKLAAPLIFLFERLLAELAALADTAAGVAAIIFAVAATDAFLTSIAKLECLVFLGWDPSWEVVIFDFLLIAAVATEDEDEDEDEDADADADEEWELELNLATIVLERLLDKYNVIISVSFP